MADVLDHYRADADAPVEPGVYRVVGSSAATDAVDGDVDADDADTPDDGDDADTPDDGDDEDGAAVTLLRVVEDGRRVDSGVVVTLDRGELDALAPAGNPDTGLGRLRQVPGTLAAHPLVAGGALLAVGVGASLRVVEGMGAGTVAVAGGLLALWVLLT